MLNMASQRLVAALLPMHRVRGWRGSDPMGNEKT
jgi:hypothetical protein